MSACKIAISSGILGLFISAPALAADATVQGRPEAFSKLIECRAITDSAQRLACYDKQTALLDEAERKNEVMVVDRQQVKTAKRGLFGLSLPNLGGLFGKDDGKLDDVEEVTSIDSMIKGVGTNANGKWVLILDDGARWVQTDTASIRSPKVGQPIKIKRAAMGSFFANVNGQSAIRMRREN